MREESSCNKGFSWVPNFDGHVALVTGASKGIGAACAAAFGALGARVAVHYHNDAEGAARTASGLVAETFGADLRQWSAAQDLVQRVVDRMGSLDHIVVNHGIWKSAPIDRMTNDDYNEMFDANLRGLFALCGAAARAMRKNHGSSIVLIASTAGQRGEAEHSHYAAVKGAAISITKSLAVELAPAGIRVNCVAPGWVATSMTEGALSDEARARQIHATIPLGRVGLPEEIASVVAFVASSAASFMTGEIVNVNGGAVLCG